MKKAIFGALVAGTALFSACNGSGLPKADLNNETDTLSYILGVANSPSEEEIKAYLTQAGGDSAYVDAFLKGLKDGLNVPDDKKEMAYQLGIQSGMQIKTRMFTGLENQVFAGDSTRHLSTKQFLAGFMAGHKGQSGLIIGKDTISRENVQTHFMNIVERMTAAANERVYGEGKKKSEEFIEQKAKENDIKAIGESTQPSEKVYYKEISAGNGVMPKADQVVEVKYEGRLVNGTVFDSSRDESVKFRCDQVIKGWTIALTHMKEGSEWEVYIPWNLAYGANAQGPIPPYSALIFKIKLVKVAPAEDKNAQ